MQKLLGFQIIDAHYILQDLNTCIEMYVHSIHILFSGVVILFEDFP